MKKLKIRIKSTGGVIPKYAKPGDAGMDLTATSRKIVEEKEFGYIEYGTGLSFEIPEGYYMDIRPRSSISNTGMILANSPATIDSQYRGEVMVRFKWIAGTKMYDVGERIAQFVILEYPFVEFEEAEELTATERGEGGFGHTGN